MTLRDLFLGLVLVAVGFTGLTGCTYETNNYYGDFDAGGVAADGSEDNVGDSNIFFPDDRTSGSAVIILGQPAIALVDVRTKDHQPHVITCTLGSMIAQSPPPIANGAVDLEVVALLEIGVGAVPILASVDYVQGQTFSLVANTLRISAIYQRVPTATAAITGNPSYNAGAAVSSGATAIGVPPQRTLGFHDSFVKFGPGMTMTYDIPKFAKNLTVIANPSNAQMDITFLNNQGTGMATFPAVGFPTQKVTIPNGAAQVLVTNSSLAVSITGFYLTFDLNL